jgi:hypothetical protein
MKVIDLAIGFSKGIIPPKIKYKGVVYEYSETLKEYIKYESCENFNLCYKTLQINVEQFNDEIEIIEDTPKEDKKIEKLDLSDWWEITSSEDCKPEMLSKIFNKNAITFSSKINEIIDKVNGDK